MKTFRHGGKLGDLIYALPTIRELGGGILYIPERTPDGVTNMYSNMKRLLELQPYIKEVREYPSGLAYKELAPGIHIDYDLDMARDQPAKGVIHIVKRYMDAFGIKIPNWKDPWLSIERHHVERGPEYTIFNYTGRHIINDRMPSRPFDWKNLWDSIEGNKYFIGTTDEVIQFREIVKSDVDYVVTNDALEVAIWVNQAKAVYCNQSLVLTLAQATGTPYYLFPKPFKTNCILNNVPYENILR
ncbi:hypothetical protein [Paraflavitalea pollutisoli]|uniref:hypothetical protein n=1 Tax=Paraflavitalea pollutisoli TaxID=3034143 RepID=UPI0023EBC92F|nr:hypothetical protein [Paraflavitalea sp. H1-2-19X]